MVHKLTVGLQQKIGQPNFGSVGASCSIEVHLDDEEAMNPGQVASRIQQAFAQCRGSIAKELSIHETEQLYEATIPSNAKADFHHEPDRNRAANRSQRTATEAQVRAIRAIASKVGVSLASELEQGFGVRSPNQLTIAQASQLIDSLKQGLTSSST